MNKAKQNCGSPARVRETATISRGHVTTVTTSGREEAVKPPLGSVCPVCGGWLRIDINSGEIIGCDTCEYPNGTDLDRPTIYTYSRTLTPKMESRNVKP